MNVIHSIARVCHEANRAWCEINGDQTQKSWWDAEEWQRQSASEGVSFAISNPDAPDSAQHDAWCEAKRRDGWVYGPEKNADAKTHPCLVPFDQLPPEQQAKDRLFKAIVGALYRA